jgi:hypothetical protein
MILASCFLPRAAFVVVAEDTPYTTAVTPFPGVGGQMAGFQAQQKFVERVSTLQWYQERAGIPINTCQRFSR